MLNKIRARSLTRLKDAGLRDDFLLRWRYPGLRDDRAGVPRLQWRSAHDSIGGRGGGSKLSLRSMDTVHPLLEGVGALTIPRDGPVGIPLALAAAFAFRACELPSSAYHGPLVAPGLKLSALQHALARAGVGVVNLVTIFCRDHEHTMPRGRVSHGFVELRADTFFLRYGSPGRPRQYCVRPTAGHNSTATPACPSPAKAMTAATQSTRSTIICAYPHLL